MIICALVYLSFVFSAGTTAHSHSFLIELNDEIVGPAMKTQGVRVEPNGAVIEERYDFTSSKVESHTEVVLCTHPPEKLDTLVARALSLSANLPDVVDETKSIPIDGPFRTIVIFYGREARRSVWYAPSEQGLSRQATRFVAAWRGIKNLLLACKASGH